MKITANTINYNSFMRSVKYCDLRVQSNHSIVKQMKYTHSSPEAQQSISIFIPSIFLSGLLPTN